jgi:uncharacterized membrane protein YhiD involved in acid resistance
MALMDNARGISTAVIDYVEANTLGVAVGAGVAALGTGVALAALGGKKSKKKNRKRITHTKRGLAQDRKRRSKQKWEVAYRRRKNKKSRKSKRGIKYTKKGQPYIILASGKARFIKGKRRKR